MVATFDLKTTYSLLDTPAGRKKKARGPGQIGQGKEVVRIRIHGVTLDELKKRLNNAKALLETGKIPKEKDVPSAPKPSAKTGDDEAEAIRVWLTGKGVKFNKQLGLKKLKALKKETEEKADKTVHPAGPPEEKAK